MYVSNLRQQATGAMRQSSVHVENALRQGGCGASCGGTNGCALVTSLKVDLRHLLLHKMLYADLRTHARDKVERILLHAHLYLQFLQKCDRQQCKDLGPEDGA